MKAEGHPDYHTIKVVLTTGESYETRSTWGSEGEEMRLDIDPNNHPAWTGGNQKIVEQGRLTKFKNKYEGFGLVGDAK